MLPAKHLVAPAVFLVLAGVAVIWSTTGPSDPEVVEPSRPKVEIHKPVNRPVVVHKDGFVGSDSCQECHQESYRSWYASYHRTMTQVAAPETVLGQFDDVRLEILGTQHKLRRQGDSFLVETTVTGPDGGPSSEHPVVMTTGSHHFQLYWMASGQSRALKLFPFSFWIDQQRWIPTQAQFLMPEFDSALTPPLGMWNRDCQICHATHVRPRIVARHMDTHLAEFGISCEECHGPAEQHVASTHRDLDDLAIVQPARLLPEHSAALCGQCHCNHEIPRETWQHWLRNGDPFRPGDDLEDHREIVESDDSIFWPDGQVRTNGREYNGLIISPCYTHDDPAGRMTCLSCHDMHQQPGDARPVEAWANDQLKPAMDCNTPGVHNNVACTQCHQEYADDATLTAHTFHTKSSSGSECYNCHMPHTTWGLMKASRSHIITSPNVSESLAPVGRPNACNLCHLDKTLDWTARQLHDRYSHDVPDLSADEQSIAASILWALRGDAAQRAFIAWSMGWEPARSVSADDWMAPFLTQLLVDPYPAVRGVSHQSLQKIDGFDQIVYDHVGPGEQREAVRLEAVDIWENLSQARNPETAAEVLQETSGALRESELVRLLNQRDDRPVIIQE